MKIHNPFKAIKAYAWFSPTHAYIFENAFELLKLRNEEVHKAYLPYEKEIASAVLIPDFKGDINKGSGAHYYSPVLKNGKCDDAVLGYYKNRLGRFSKSARTMLEENITHAAIYKKSRNEKMYAESVGRALHFIMDICCSVHTTNLISLPIKNNPHHTYEIYSREHMYDYGIDNISDIRELEERYLNMPIDKLLSNAAKCSAVYYKNMTSLKASEYKKALSNMLPFSFALTYIMLVKIYEFVNAYDGIKIGDKFTLCSDNGYLSGKGKKVFLSKEKARALTFELFEKGGKLFLKNGGRFLVCEGRFGFKYGGEFEHAAIRLTKTAKGYLISTEFLKGEKYLIPDKKTVKAKFFDPRSNGFYWTIN